MQADLAPSWRALPGPLRARMALASTGWRHLARCAALCAGRPELAAGLLLWAFGENPLHGPLAAQILAQPALPLAEASRAALSAVAGRWRAPEDRSGGKAEGLAYLQRLRERGDAGRLAAFLAGRIAREPGGLFWREAALDLAHQGGEGADELERLALDGLAELPGLSGVAASLRAQAAFLRGDAERCVHELSALPPLFGPGFAPARAGLALLRAGDSAAALPRLCEALASAPWQAALARVAAEATNGARNALAAPPGPALVLLHTRDNAPRLDATLAGLFASDLCGAKVAVLDRGSADATPEVLDAWAARAGGTLLRCATPVDIGAPAAWNWLSALPEAKTAETLAFVAEDCDLPPDWLPRLGAGLAAFPQAGVAGASWTRRTAPWRLAGAAGLLEAPEDAPAGMDFASLTPNPLGLCDAHRQGPDWGLAESLTPCAAAPGPCRLVRRAALDGAGGFALALAPGGLEDLALDLRLLEQGRHAVHQGRLRVARGPAPACAAALSNRRGDWYKVQTMHARETVAGFLSTQAALLGQAAERAFDALDAAGASR